jgi:hypothetical protein
MSAWRSQQLSGMRRRLTRGLQYLTDGVDLDKKRQSSNSSIIVDREMKIVVETFGMPLSSRLIYVLLTWKKDY